MAKYNDSDLNVAAANAFKILGHLIVVLNNFEGDLGGSGSEIENWIEEMREAESMVEYIMEISE